MNQTRMTCETHVPFDVDALIQNVQGLLEWLKKIKKAIQQTPHSVSASQSKTKRTQPSFDPITISQTLRYVVEEAQRLEAELASPSQNVMSRETRLIVPAPRNPASATYQRMSVAMMLNTGDIRSEERRTELEKDAQEGNTREPDEQNSNGQVKMCRRVIHKMKMRRTVAHELKIHREVIRRSGMGLGAIYKKTCWKAMHRLNRFTRMATNIHHQQIQSLASSP
ncbi:hypothetical protein K469DRAFT_153678 [Zopfia rhizophila CBS 207.26]|uniref:Uncharacterized protein n=1 Tax=Zopfia rhizophila CBS 207.26 TaxID=1314779 RepID=A0A6A6E662_9PEZI|nr:hypothetical protein K469DRAFT_153678 [Zopfia rhizophila CBS 207.26]